MLTLPEELLLLALRDKRGSVVSSAAMALPYGLAGAVLLELSLRDSIVLQDGKFTVRNPAPTGDDILDEALAKMRASGKSHKPSYWVSKLKGLRKMKDRLLDRLVGRGILRREEHKVLWVFPANRYPTLSGAAEMKRRDQIRSAVLHGEEPDERTFILISLVNACSLVNEIFSKEERKAARERIKIIIKGEAVGKAVSDIVAGVRVAVVAAVAASTVASTSGR
jgi:Golgi phosphoprotein 3